MIDSKKKIKCLLMCATPLQSLIAEKIITLDCNKEKEFDLIFIANKTDNLDKFRYYYAKLAPYCNNSIFWVAEPKLLNLLKFQKKLKNSIIKIRYEEIYLANIEKIFFQYVMSMNKKAKTFTFDDGIGNILPDSKFYSKKRPQVLKRLIYNLLGINQYSQDIRYRSQQHFTIYKNLSNIHNKTNYIELYEQNVDTFNVEVIRTIKIYLGQPLKNIYKDFNQEGLIRIIKNLKIDYYFPHPLESNFQFCNLKIINTHLIIEDYIIEILKNNTDAKIEIYSIISGALINMTQFNRVQVKYIYHPYFYNQYNDFYKLAENYFGIPIIDPSKFSLAVTKK